MACLTAPENQPVDYDALAEAGATFLDSPAAGCPVWLRYVDTDRLDMGSIHDDVITQIWGDGYTFADLGLTEDQAIALGLEPHVDEPEVYAHLTTAWVRAITAKRNEHLHADRKVA